MDICVRTVRRSAFLTSLVTSLLVPRSPVAGRPVFLKSAMPRPRERLTLESGPVLDLARIIPKGHGKPGGHFRTVWHFSSGEVIGIEVRLWEAHGSLDLSFGGRKQSFTLTCRQRHFGGQQWYVVCPKTWKHVRVLFRPLGAPYFASRHSWGPRAAYASQFLDPIGRAWRTKAKIKGRLIGDEDPDAWDLPPKPKRMRLRTYEHWEAKYDQAEDALGSHLCGVVARLMDR